MLTGGECMPKFREHHVHGALKVEPEDGSES